MLAYIVRRLVQALVMLAIVSLVTFAIFFLLPRLVGATPESLAAQYVGRSATADTVHAVARDLGFYDPFLLQYWHWLSAIFVGRTYDLGGSELTHCPAPCLGYSFINTQNVFTEITGRFPVTFSLAIGAAVIWVVFGVAAGVVSALRRGTVIDRASMLIALAGVSLPIFFTGMMALSIFSYTLHLTQPGGAYVPFTSNPLKWAWALLLPWITLAFQFSAQYARLTRAGMLETMNEDYIRTARAKGARERSVVVRHGMRAAMTPILTIFGLDFGLLIGGAVLTEKTFSLNGLGGYAVKAITDNDLPAVMGVVITAALFVILANLIVDLLYAVIDPRVRVH